MALDALDPFKVKRQLEGEDITGWEERIGGVQDAAGSRDWHSTPSLHVGVRGVSAKVSR